MKKRFKVILGIGIGFILGVLLMYGYWVYEDYKIMKSAEEVYLEDQCYQYYYSLLDLNQQSAYKKIYSCIKNNMKSVKISIDNLEELEKVFYSVIDDHPEFYYVTSSFEYIEGEKYILFPEYTYSDHDINEINQEIINHTDIIINQTMKQDNIEKIKTIYDYITDITEYKRNDDDQNIKSVFIEKQSVCAGYARAYQYLLNKVGIKATYMGGKAKENNEGHAWVMISLDGNYYYSDPTWGDVVTEGMEHSCYAYLMMSSDEMLKSYIPDGKYEISLQEPYNYFKVHNCYMEKYDRNVVDNAVKLGLSNKSGVAEIRCANEKVFDELKKEIEVNYLAYSILKENHCYSGRSRYLCDKKTLMVELYF